MSGPFPCDCPACEDGVCDEEGICVNCGYDYIEDSDIVDDDEEHCGSCGAELGEDDGDDEECPECGASL